MMPQPKAEFGPLSLIFAPTTWSVKLDSPYSRLMNGASGKYAGEMVNVAGTVIGSVVAVAGTTRVESTIPGRMLPTTEPMPGKFDAAPKLPFSPDGVPSRLTNGGAMLLPVNPKFGPVPPINGNCTKGWPPTLHGGPAGRNSGLKPVNCVEPLTRSGGNMIAAPVHSKVAPKNSCEFGR